MLTEIVQKVKNKVVNSVKYLNKKRKIDKPQLKFISELAMGMFLTQSCNLTEISRVLKEKISIKHTLKRLQRNVSNNGELLEILNDYTLENAKNKINSETIIALDGGDISHLYGEKFENQGKVRDGSSKRIEKGYWLNQISCYVEKLKTSFSVLLDIYSQETEDFKSANDESIKLVRKFIEKIGKLGLWVLDRGYDSGIILEEFLTQGLEFIVRMRNNRDLIYRGKKINIEKLSLKITRRYKNGEKGRYGYLKCILRIGKVDYPVTLVCYKGVKNKTPMIFLCNGHISKSREILRRIKGYFHRWGVEECYRFEKQGFGIEKSLVRNYNGIKCLLGMILLCCNILLKIREDDYLREMLIKEAKREKTQKKYRPKFLFYALLDGISNIFQGVKHVFVFRKFKYTKYFKKKKGIFDNLFKKELVLV